MNYNRLKEILQTIAPANLQAATILIEILKKEGHWTATQFSASIQYSYPCINRWINISFDSNMWPFCRVSDWAYNSVLWYMLRRLLRHAGNKRFPHSGILLAWPITNAYTNDNNLYVCQEPWAKWHFLKIQQISNLHYMCMYGTHFTFLCAVIFRFDLCYINWRFWRIAFETHINGWICG